MSTTTTGMLAKQYVERWKNTPSLTLAKKLFKEHPLVFTDIDQARHRIRYYRGQLGVKNRSTLTDRGNIKKTVRDPFKLPRSYAKKRQPVDLEGTKFLMLYDTHIPYHDNESIELAISEGEKQGCDTIFLGGDTIDCHLLSNFVKDPEARKFREEIEAARQLFDYLRQRFPTARIYFKEGNHEERFWKYMRVKAPEVLDEEFVSLEAILKLKEFNIQWINGRTKARIGRLSVFHGHEFGKSIMSPVNIARGLYLKAKASSICGHYHQTSEHTERDVNDKMITCWSIGCLSELSPEYSPFNKWNHGFAIIKKDGENFHVQNFRIYKGRLL